jgi:hypothetical protein
LAGLEVTAAGAVETARRLLRLFDEDPKGGQPLHSPSIVGVYQ